MILLLHSTAIGSEMDFLELDNDQRRETVNTRQRFESWRRAIQRERSYKGSMTWITQGDVDYLVRSYYDETNIRRQKSLGRRSSETEALKATFDAEREQAVERRKSLEQALERQAAINRVIGLGRVPLDAARILRNLDRRGLLGAGLRVAGTNALYAYEAASGVVLDTGITTTTDIDLLFDARRKLFLVADPELATGDLLDLLRLADRSFQRTQQGYRAESRTGYLVDLIKPARNPPWSDERNSLGGSGDLYAAEIDGLVWLENAPAFEQLAIDESGTPVRIVAPDPRVFAIHKHWLSQRGDRDPVKRRRDHDQSKAVTEIVRRYLLHLSFETADLRMVPLDIVNRFRLAMNV